MTDFNRRVLDRKQAREEAAAPAMSLLVEAAAGLPEAGQEAFWEEILAFAKRRCPATPVTTARATMTEDAAARFERTEMPYRVDLGPTLGEAMRTRRGRKFLRWLACQTFIDQLRQYMEVPSIARELADTEAGDQQWIPAEDWES